jgi:hypothetical protein
VTDHRAARGPFRQFQYLTAPLRVSIAKLRAVHAATHPAGNDNAGGADIRVLQPVPGAHQTS